LEFLSSKSQRHLLIQRIDSSQEVSPMANEEHLALLKQGVSAWNAWREDSPGVEPDRSHADLHGVTLIGVNLSPAGL